MDTWRQSTDNGPSPLNPTDIAAWQSQSGAILTRAELRVIDRMDGAYLAEMGLERQDALARMREKEAK